jgi:alpha-L-fucosidase
MFVRRLPLPVLFVVVTALLAATPAAGQRPAASPAETPAQHDARMRWWREARFGLFIHWGLYAVPAGEWDGQRSKEVGEWIMSWANIPRARYETLAPRFDPEKFDAAAWVRLAKDAGMKYIVVTSKHHDGFAMFDSAVSDYDIVDRTPFKRDPMRALAAEAKKQGLVFCFYYSIMDWHHPSQYVDRPGKDRTAGDGRNEMLPDQKAAYVAYMKAQLKELVTRYDPGVLWFDGEWTGWWTEADGKDLYAYVRGLKPSILINNRVGKGRDGMRGLNTQSPDGQPWAGDFGTPEQEIPPTGLPGVDWESCMTMNDTWGYKSYDDRWKSSSMLIRNLIDVASKGGNYLLNVGPTAEGLIPAASVERLRDIGAWMKVNGAAIHGTSASPFTAPLPFGRATRKGRTIYLHVFDWPADGKLHLTPAAVAQLGGTPAKAYRLAAPATPLAIAAGGDGLTIDAGGAAADPVATVVAIDLR